MKKWKKKNYFFCSTIFFFSFWLIAISLTVYRFETMKNVRDLMIHQLSHLARNNREIIKRKVEAEEGSSQYRKVKG